MKEVKAVLIWERGLGCWVNVDLLDIENLGRAIKSSPFLAKQVSQN